jgi:hypothetical protein
MVPMRSVAAWMAVGLALACAACGDDGMRIQIVDAYMDEMSIDTAMPDAAMPLLPQAYIKAMMPQVDAAFGGSITEIATTTLALSADGSTLAVTAIGDASNAVGVNGTITNYDKTFSGAVWIYVRSGGVWSPQAYLKAPADTDWLRFGTAVAISDDGNTLAVSTPYGTGAIGHVYVFTRSAGTWSQQAMLSPTTTEPSDFFGWSVSISGNGDMIAAGATSEASGTGDVNDNSAPAAGAVYVFTRAGTIWDQQAYIKPLTPEMGDNFGYRVALSSDTTTLAVSAPFEDSGTTSPTDNSAAFAGAAYVFTRSGLVWTQQAYLKASNIDAGDAFGKTLAINANGSTLVVGATGEQSGAVGINGDQTDDSITLAGAAYVLTRSGTSWTQQAYIKAHNTYIPAGSDGFSVSLALSSSGNRLAVGADWDDSSTAIAPLNGNAVNSGAVYLYDRMGTTWMPTRYVKATNLDVFDFFGEHVALSGDGSTLAVGAHGEDSAAVGVNGNGADDSLSNAGACYVYLP